MAVAAGSAPAGFGGVGFIGLGDMGGPMADNLVAAGFDVTVFDARPEPLRAAAAKGARIGTTLAALASTCSTIGICVWSDEQLVGAVLGEEGLIAGTAKSLTLVVHSTVRPATIERIAKAFAARAWSVIDAPVSGGRAASLTGTLSLMVGGDKSLFERHQPYLDAVGKNIFYVGAMPGLGEVAKLCNNLMGLCSAFAIVEGMKLGAAYGLDEETICRIASVSTGNSWYIQNWGFFDHLIKTHPQPDILYKDLWEAVHAGKDKGLQLVITGMVALTAPRLMSERHAELTRREAANDAVKG
ncbi:MAG: NAD(P)-dependent oxidoreductase [Burkholderiales bacterium]|nr:MAG: NAD(P)-dependent oxidoreductase [Burkholderiales bacterium]